MLFQNISLDTDQARAKTKLLSFYYDVIPRMRLCYLLSIPALLSTDYIAYILCKERIKGAASSNQSWHRIYQNIQTCP